MCCWCSQVRGRVFDDQQMSRSFSSIDWWGGSLSIVLKAQGMLMSDKTPQNDPSHFDLNLYLFNLYTKPFSGWCFQNFFFSFRKPVFIYKYRYNTGIYIIYIYIIYIPLQPCPLYVHLFNILHNFSFLAPISADYPPKLT